jgi:hypothetical protein
VTTKVHQALHGYSDGHRQFACSAELAPKDARLVLVMSDASGSGVTSEGQPYLTGYPLQESGLYALAMTWPAPEMPRPGCVWTHTLFIEFADLALLDSPSLLSKLFRRPSIDNPGGYGIPLHANGSATTQIPISNDQELWEQWFSKLSSALYEHPHEQIWARRGADSFVDEVVLRIWDLQWPRLRRSFKFCTLTTKDRSQEGLPFDLQLCPRGDATARFRFADRADGYEATSMSSEPWLIELVQYAHNPTASSLREILRLLGTDVLGGREAMRPICSLQSALSSLNSSSLAHAIDLVRETNILSSSRVAKEMVTRVALSQPNSLEPEALMFVIEHLDFLNESELANRASELTSILWKSAPAKLLELFVDERPTIRNSMRIAAREIQIDELVRAIVAAPNWTQPLLAVRPDLADSRSFWEQTQAFPAVVQAGGIDLRSGVTRQAVVLGLRDEGAITSAFQVFGALSILENLQLLTSSQQELPQLQRWVRHACLHIDAVASFLAHTKSLSMQLVMRIASELPPDAVPNEFGTDPWFTALADMRNVGGELPIEMYAYGFRRALGSRSRSVGPLLCLTFEPLHKAASEQAIPESSWQSLQHSLPWTKPTESWDGSLRLRRAVAKRCVEISATAEEFVSLTTSERVFTLLLDEVWEQWGGSRYLKRIGEVLGGTSNSRLQPRLRLIEEYVKKKSSWWK